MSTRCEECGSELYGDWHEGYYCQMCRVNKKLEIAVKALEFYGDSDNWMIYDGIAIIDDDYENDGHGKIARQALREIKGE